MPRDTAYDYMVVVTLAMTLTVMVFDPVIPSRVPVAPSSCAAGSSELAQNTVRSDAQIVRDFLEEAGVLSCTAPSMTWVDLKGYVGGRPSG